MEPVMEEKPGNDDDEPNEPSGDEADTEEEEKQSQDLGGFVVDPEGDFIYYWMGLVTIAVGYNLWMTIMRIAYREMREEVFYRSIFSTLDFICDVVYTVDIFVQFRIGYLEDGILVRDHVKLNENYRKKFLFKLDCLSILPLGLIAQMTAAAASMFTYADCGVDSDSALIQILRLPRLLKFYTMSTFFQVTDSRTSNPNRLRALKLSLYLAVVIHWIGCFYYMLSEAEGFGTNEWVYPDTPEDRKLLRKYILCFYWSTMTLTTIGETAVPQTDIEYVFTGITFLIGVFLFAAVVGNVGDVISNMNAARQEFQAKMDAIKFYMNHRQVPSCLQSRVKKWSEYAWHRTQALDDQHFLEMLPHRLRAEIAIHVHLETLKKVRIFEDCEQGLLCELVLKLRSQIYSPGDYICRSGEIGREMYIINHGKVQVVVQDPQTGMKMVVATLSEGNYFGEISLLKLDEGQNRRTADVVSLGYSELLCLSKKDLMQALVEYPDAKKVLEKHGRDRMEKNKEAARLQRRKSEALLQIPGYLKSQDERKDTAHQDTAQSKTEVTTHGQKTTIQERGKEIGKEMSELRHIIHELRTFDSQATKHKVEQLAEKCNVLTDLLHKRDSELRRALSRISELEQRVIGKMKNGKVCPAKSYELHNGDLPNGNGSRHRSADGISSDESPSCYYRVHGMPSPRRTRRLDRQKRTEFMMNGNHYGNINVNRTPKSVINVPKLNIEPANNDGDGGVKRTMEVAVPGICINDVLHQEPSSCTISVAESDVCDQYSEISDTSYMSNMLLLAVDVESDRTGDISDLGSFQSDASYESDF